MVPIPAVVLLTVPSSDDQWNRLYYPFHQSLSVFFCFCFPPLPLSRIDIDQRPSEDRTRRNKEASYGRQSKIDFLLEDRNMGDVSESVRAKLKHLFSPQVKCLMMF